MVRIVIERNFAIKRHEENKSVVTGKEKGRAKKIRLNVNTKEANTYTGKPRILRNF